MVFVAQLNISVEGAALVLLMKQQKG